MNKNFILVTTSNFILRHDLLERLTTIGLVNQPNIINMFDKFILRTKDSDYIGESVYLYGIKPRLLNETLIEDIQLNLALGLPLQLLQNED